MRIKAGGVAVVTGAGSGIGRALARQLGSRGCRLALCDIDEAALAATVDGLRASEVLSFKVDVANREQVHGFADQVYDRFGRVDVVINNAGVDLSQTALDASYEDMEWLLGINFWGVVHGTKAFAPRMVAAGSGTVVNVASIFSMVAWPAHSSYAASKFAVRGFTEALDAELRGSGVSVACVLPGGVDTGIVEKSRFYVDDLGRSDHDASMREFREIAKTSPADAARTILQGVERGKKRILVGRDARALDLLVRCAPQRYWSLIEKLQRVARPGEARRPAARIPADQVAES
jgi:short-subunit dehydrogenase